MCWRLFAVALVSVSLTCCNVNIGGEVNQDLNQGTTINYTVETPNGETEYYTEDDAGVITPIEPDESSVQNIKLGVVIEDIVWKYISSQNHLNLTFLLRNVGTETITWMSFLCRFNYVSGRDYGEYVLFDDISPGFLNEELDVEYVSAEPVSVEFIQIVVNGILLELSSPFTIYP